MEAYYTLMLIKGTMSDLVFSLYTHTSDTWHVFMILQKNVFHGYECIALSFYPSPSRT